MTRNREQKGSVVRIGAYWCVRFADWVIEDGVRRRKQGLTHKLTSILPEHNRLKNPPAYVKKLQQEYMAKVNGGRHKPEHCATISEFVEDAWLPFVESQRASSTFDVYRSYWTKMLKPRCGDKLLRDFNTAHAQALLDEIAREDPELRSATLHKLKSMLSAIFRLAIQRDCRSGPNPIRETSLPKAPGPQETHAYDLETIRQILAAVSNETCKVVIALAAYAGLSKSEIQGLVWEAYNGSELTVLTSVVNGKRGDPKTKARRDTVPLIEPLRRMLDMHHLKSGSPETGVMFPTRNGSPLSLHNLFCDYIQRDLVAASLPWFGWHGFRRGLATNLHDLGVDDMTIQRIMRHSHVSITQKAYIKTMPRQVVDAMAQLEAAIAKQDAKPEIVQ